MSITLDCECHRRFQVPDSKAGLPVACPSCGLEYRAPGVPLKIRREMYSPKAGPITRFFRGLVTGLKLVAVLFLAAFVFAVISSIKAVPRAAPHVGPELVTQPALLPPGMEFPPPVPDDVPPRKVMLSRPGGAGHVHFCLDREAYAELQAALVAKKMGDFTRLRDAGRILLIPNETAGLVVGHDGAADRVQLTEGDYVNQEGWVDPQYVHSL